MIPVKDLREMGFLSTGNLEKILRKDGIDATVVSADFLGVSNEGQFAYMCQVVRDDGEPQSAKIWLARSGLTGAILADY